MSTEADEARHGRAQHLLEYEAPGTALLVVFYYAHLRLRAEHQLRLMYVAIEQQSVHVLRRT